MEKNLKNIEFIAEIASSHNGSIKILKNLVEQLISSEVNSIKFQIFKLNKLAHPSYKFFNALKKISITTNQYEKIIRKVLKSRKKVILEPFDKESFEFCKKFKKKVSIKISSSDNENIDLIKKSLKHFDKVFISVSGYKISSVEKLFKKLNKPKKLIFTYGFQSFPTNLENIRMGFLREMKRKNMRVCYADHTCRDNIFENIAIISKAINNGSCFIEKHVILDKKKDYTDKISSLDVLELNDLIKFFKIKIPNKITISNQEKKYSSLMGKKGVFLNDLKKGQIFSKEKVIFLRTGPEGILEKNLNRFYNKKLKKDVKKGQIINKEFFN